MKKTVLTFLIIVSSASGMAFAHSKYSEEFKQNFSICKPFSESKFNLEYNSNNTYEIKGFAPDGSGNCIYVETNEWKRGKYITTCSFSPAQQKEFLNAMIYPDVKTSVQINGMAFVDSNEKAVYLKYYNNLSVCRTEKK